MDHNDPEYAVEFAELRATIRQRGTARTCLFVIGLVWWAALTVATAALSAPPVATLIPLVALAATFEAVYALHVGVERIGRYLHVFHNDTWERATEAFGRPAGAVALDPLFCGLFLIGCVVNLEPLLVAAPTLQEGVFVGGAHALFALRIITARAASVRQRGIDEQRFRAIRDQSRER